MLERRRIERTGKGDIRLRLPRDERALLRSLPAELRRLLADAPEDPSLERLRPGDPHALEASIHAYLSWLQEQLVEALEGDFRQ